MEILIAIALSSHIGFEHEYNFVHPHLRVQYENIISGIYLNSEEDVSVYGGIRSEFGNFGLEYGVVGGYDSFETVSPMLRGTYNFNENFLVYAAPSREVVGRETNYGVVLGMELQFK